MIGKDDIAARYTDLAIFFVAVLVLPQTDGKRQGVFVVPNDFGYFDCPVTGSVNGDLSSAVPLTNSSLTA